MLLMEKHHGTYSRVSGPQITSQNYIFYCQYTDCISKEYIPQSYIIDFGVFLSTF